MAKGKNSGRVTKTTGANVGYEAQLWQMADALRGSMDPAEAVEDDGEPFEEKMQRLAATLRE